MRQALSILRKDIRHLWPRIAVFVCLAAVYANGDASAPHNPRLEGPGILLSVALWLAAAFLVVSAVHEDRLIGDRQFWLTRPYSWKSLLLAKALFVLLFVSLPVLLAQIGALVSNGISPLEYVPELLWRQAGLAAWTILPCAALAAVTRNLVQVVVTALIAFAVFVGVLFTIAPDWGVRGSVAQVDTAGHASIAMFFAAWACGWQFARRRAIVARCLLVCAVVATVTWFPIVPWRAGFAWLMWRSQAVESATVRLSPDSPRKVGGGWGYTEEGDKLPIFFPIQLTGIPDGMLAHCERVRVTVQAPDGRTWSSGWSTDSDVTDHTPGYASLRQLLPGEGAPYWLVAGVDKSFYHAFSAEPVHVRAEVAFTLLDRARTTQLNAIEAAEPIADRGFCYPSGNGSFTSLICVTPFRTPSLLLLRRPENVTAIGSAEPLQATVFSIWERSSMALSPGPFEASIETRHAVAHFVRDLDMPGVVLAELRGQ